MPEQSVDFHTQRLTEEIRLLKAKRLVHLRDSNAYKRLGRRIQKVEKELAYFKKLQIRKHNSDMKERIRSIINGSQA